MNWYKKDVSLLKISRRVRAAEGSTKPLIEQALQVELTKHLGYALHPPKGGGTGNVHNVTTGKRMQTEHGPHPLWVPRENQSRFEPVLVINEAKEG